MSQISQKSITGITSITTPVGIDDVFTVHSGDTTERFRVDQSGNQNISGVVTATNFKTGSSNLHSTGLTVGDTLVHATGVNGSSADIDDFISVGNNIHLGNAGVVTATSFVGSGANLTGIDATAIKDSGGNVKVQAQASGAVYTGIHTFNSGAEVGSNIKLGNAGVITATSFVGDGSDLTNLPAGLGTALSATASNPLNKMYYTNQVLGVGATVTVDPPASASKAYTQYADIKVDSDADLIIAEGDDLIPDVLGLADFGTFGGGASAGRIRVNSITNAAANGAPTIQNGVVISGMTTITGGLSIGGTITYEDVTNIDSVGVITARSGVDVDDFVSVGSNIHLGNAGVVTATTFSGAVSGTTGTFSSDLSIADKIVHTGDTDTAIRFPSANTVSVEAAGVQKLSLSTGEVVFNDTGIDCDFRIEGDSNANLVKVDAGNDRVGVGVASPQQVFHVYHASDNGLARFESGDSQCRIDLVDNSGQASIESIGDVLRFGTSSSNTERLRITSSGQMGLGMTPTRMFEVKDSTNANRIMNIRGTGTSGAFLAFLDANTTDDSKCRIGSIGGNSIGMRGDAHHFQNGAGTDRMVIDSVGNANIAGVCTANTFKGILVPTTYHGGRRNMFINGEFMINQRGTRNPMANQDNGANGLGYGGPDHVQFVTNLGAFDAKQANENNSPRSQAGAVYSYELDCTSASGPSTSNYTFLKFKWSGLDAARLLYGTSNARPVTISFWVQCNKTGNFTATLRNETADKLISSVVTISSSNTWEYKTITFVGDTAAQIAVTQGDRWNLELWLDGGSNYTGGTVRTGWTTKNNADRGAGSTLNICSSTSNYFRLSLFQVEMGSHATPYEFRTYTEYLKDCEYFFQKPHAEPFAVHIWGHKVADTYALRAQTMLRPTEMRVNPTDYYHDNDSTKHAQRFQTQGSDYEYTYNVAMGIGSNKKEFSNGTKYPYGVNGVSSAESAILWAFDFESYAEY